MPQFNEMTVLYFETEITVHFEFPLDHIVKWIVEE